MVGVFRPIGLVACKWLFGGFDLRSAPPALPAAPLQTFRSYLRRVVLPSVTSKHGEYLLAEVVKRWEHHKIMNKWMFRFFMYLVCSNTQWRAHKCPPSPCTLLSVCNIL